MAAARRPSTASGMPRQSSAVLDAGAVARSDEAVVSGVKFEVDGVERVIESTIGVKQGDILGPTLFIFYIAAIMETWRESSTYELATFRTAPDYQMTGRRVNAKGAEFTFGDSEDARDAAPELAFEYPGPKLSRTVVVTFSTPIIRANPKSMIFAS